MVATSLQDDLLGIPGVEGAEVDGSNDAPAGLRIRIAQGADQDAVGGAIRRVLSAHGLGTDTQLPGEDSEALAALDESAVSVLTAEEPSVAGDIDFDEGNTVIDLTDNEPMQLTAEPMNSDGSEDLTESSDSQSLSDPNPLPPFVEARTATSETVPSEDVAPSESPQESIVMEDDRPSTEKIARIDSIAVVEGRSGIIITVTASDGSKTSAAASSTEGGVENAVVKATSRLVDPQSPDPIVVEIEDRRVDGVDIVMVVLDADGTLVTGSAVVVAGRAFALGRATWAALAL